MSDILGTLVARQFGVFIDTAAVDEEVLVDEKGCLNQTIFWNGCKFVEKTRRPIGPVPERVRW